eukprot:747356-Hanusia_phi.AAC.1
MAKTKSYSFPPPPGEGRACSKDAIERSGMSLAVMVGARPRQVDGRQFEAAQEVKLTPQVVQDLFHMRQVDAATAL